MHTPFFPLNSVQEIYDRKALILSEFNSWAPDDILVSEFMNLSDRAHKRREDRIQAAKDGKIYVG